MLHAALLADLAEEPTPVAGPPANLDFLRWTSYFSQLRSLTLRLTRAIAAVLTPKALPDLEGLADLFFDYVQDLGDEVWASSSASGALAFAEGDLSPETRVLAATWVATRQLSERLSAQEIADLKRAGRWQERSRQTAAQAAADWGFEPRAASRFAAEYARLVSHETIPLPTKPAAERGSQD